MAVQTTDLIVIGPLTEVTQELKMVSSVDQDAVETGDYASVKIGDSGTYFDHLIDADGQKVGEVFGRAEAVYRRESDGHFFSWYREEITLPDGTALYEGPLDTTAAIAGGVVRAPIVGTGGRYEGLLGLREVRVANAKLLTDVKFVFFPGYSA